MKKTLAAAAAVLLLGSPDAKAQGGFGVLLASTPPGLAFQFRPCMEEDDVDKAVQNLTRALRDPVTLAEPDVRATCIAAGGGGLQTIGAWLTPLPPNVMWFRVMRLIEDAARTRGLASVRLLGVNESFAWSVSRGFFAELRDRTWATMPRTIDVYGNPDDDGPISLSSLAFGLVAPDTIRTDVRGNYNYLVDYGLGEVELHIGFRLRATDTIAIDDNGKLRTTSSTDLNVDRSELDYLTVSALVQFLPLGLDVEQRLDAVDDVQAPDLGTATFGSLVAAAAPNKILLPGNFKLDYEHWRFDVASKYVTGGGGINILARDPTVAIVGPRSEVATTRTVTYRYSIIPDDLRSTRDEPLQIEWSADGDVAAPSAWATDIEFQIPNDVPRGETVDKSVTVRVTDADGLQAERTITLHIRYDPTGRPPICTKKPWLPECMPGIDRD